MKSMWKGVLVGVLLGSGFLAAQEESFHPPVRFLDARGRSVLESGGPLSSIRTCGQCHDASYIQAHSHHVCVGFRETAPVGKVPGGRPWDWSPGLFGRWDPLFYRYLTPKGDPVLDMGTADWVRLMGWRHVGWGPAHYARNLTPLADLPPGPKGDPETWVLDPGTGEPRPWDWKKSGTTEMDCFLCHMAGPDNAARIGELRAGRFRWAVTATLAGAGLVERKGGKWTWKKEAFSRDGSPRKDLFRVTSPTCTHCGACHGLVHRSPDPLVLKYDLEKEFSTETMGQVFSAQRIGASGLNLKDKVRLSRPWDIHAERAVGCVHCHHALDHPGLYKERKGTRPSFLTFDPRILDLGKYLRRPDHNFAKGHAAQYPAGKLLRGTARRCVDCHDYEDTHQWLPYAGRHAEKLRCEACHIPHMYAPARMQTDWTVLTKDAKPRVERRGIMGPAGDVRSLITGFDPLLLVGDLQQEEGKLTPCNLITSWYWVGGKPERPVRLYDLEKAWFEDGAYHPDLVKVLDTNKNGKVDPEELKLDTPAKVAAVRKRLVAVGVKNPRIVGEIQPYSLHHDTASGKWAVRECVDCHTRKSRLTRPFQLAAYLPGGVLPKPVGDSFMEIDPAAIVKKGDALYYRPATRAEGLFILGHDRLGWVDKVGILFFVLTLVGVFLHGGGRILAARWRRKGA